jgi:hypothetical protein
MEHFPVLSERHLHRVMNECQEYFNRARPHRGIGQRIPCRPPQWTEPSGSEQVISRPALGGLHHDNQWARMRDHRIAELRNGWRYSAARTGRSQVLLLLDGLEIVTEPRFAERFVGWQRVGEKGEENLFVSARELEARSSSAGTEDSASEPPDLPTGRLQAPARLVLDLGWIGRCIAAVKRRAGHRTWLSGFMGQHSAPWAHLPPSSRTSSGRSMPGCGPGPRRERPTARSSARWLPRSRPGSGR